MVKVKFGKTSKKSQNIMKTIEGFENLMLSFELQHHDKILSNVMAISYLEICSLQSTVALNYGSS